ncbi:MAG: undecaprenyl-phosphate glucose phosphotransferase [Paludibacteraceae bacterium]|jgi:putative colanic acid biosynthesis UDP-glucose lipid carrier transferase|nr:undecaprenyl-phosphate glucose phosphotransferase [Paludibacteraceae bacterium]
MRKEKQQKKAGLLKIIVGIGDFIVINTCFLAILYLSGELYGTGLHGIKTQLLLINLAYAVSLSIFGIILDKRIVYMEKILNLTTKTILLFSSITLSSILILGNNQIPAKSWAIYFALAFVFVSIWRILSRVTVKIYRKSGGNYRNVIILGAGSVAKETYETISHNLISGYRFLGFFDDRNPEDYKVDSKMVMGKLEDVEKYSQENNIDEIICALPAGDDRKALPILHFAENHLIRFYIIPDFKRFIKKSVSLSTLGENIPIVSLREEPLRKTTNKVVKRAFDIICSLGFNLTVFPLIFIIVAPMIKLSSKGPIFFKQKRTGENGEEFDCLKFRTMKVNKDADKVQATQNDSRVTKIGAFLRKTNLDETPQFLNVLYGNMSIVGPRPHMLQHTETYSQLIDKYMVRHYIKPGITGWAQVTGFRGETKDLSEMEGRVKQDVWYIENWTFWLDIKIIFLTAFNMIKGEEKAY